MGTKYSSQSATGYNSSPPSDDGSTTDANKVKWSTHKTKLADPIKTLADNINSALSTHFDVGPVAKSSAYTTTAADYQKTIEVTGTTPISLGDASTMTAGYTVTIYNADASLITTVDLATGADTLDGTAAGSATLNPGESTTFVVNTAADGYLSTSNTGAKLGVTNTFTKTQTWTKGADKPSATALDLATLADGNYFDVTGTTAITSISSLGVGTVIKLHFDGIVTLTHHATDLILPEGGNITTAAGDEAEFIEYASGDWRLTNYKGAVKAFSVNRNNVDQGSFIHNTLVQVQFDTDDFSDPDYDTGTYTYTPKVAGKYLITFTAGMTAAADGSNVEVYIYKNGSSYKRAKCATGNAQTIYPCVSAVVDMNGSTDAITFYVRQWHPSTTTLTLDGSNDISYATGVKIG